MKKTRQEQYLERQAKQGIKRVVVLIPEADTERVLRYAARLRKQWRKHVND